MYFYILCPAECESGGPELAHQLCQILVGLGHQAYMYYVRGGQKDPVDVDAAEKYRKYGTDHVRCMLELNMDSVVIVPEALTTWIPEIPAGRKIVWWMSVDGYFTNTGGSNLNFLEEHVSYHLVQSHYAQNYLLNNTKISADKILYLSDYIGDSYGQFLFPVQYRQNMVLYNPKKGLADLYPLLTAIEGIKWVPLENMTEEQMIVMMQAAKAYIDFGPHPGKDRIPREAASCGCCVVTNKKGSAAFYEDVPIPDHYKFEDVQASYFEIAVLLKDICDNYESHFPDFAEYRKFIAGEKAQFIEDVRKMTDIFREKFGPERRNILLVKSITPYDSSGRYIDEMASGMRKCGCNTYVLDAWSLASPESYKQIISNCKFDAVIDIVGMLCDYGATEKLPAGTIYGMYLCDPPKAFDKNLKKADDRTVVFCCDNDFRNYIDRFYQNIKHTEFIPLSGSAYPKSIPYEDRTIDILFTGTYEEPENIRRHALSRFEGGTLARFLEDMFADIRVNTWHTLEDCLSAVLHNYGLNIDTVEFDELMGEFIDVQWYARSYFRDKLIRTLLGAGLKIHVFGSGWGTFYSEWNDNLVIHEGGVYAAAKALANAKISLNIMPWFKDGFQERIAAAMLSKAVAVTDGSKYIDANFKDGQDLVIYSLQDMEILAERIRYLLVHPKEAEKIAENGYKKAQSHTWFCRVQDMLRKMEADFGVPFIQNGEGRELRLEAVYQKQNIMLLDAVYELKKMADLADGIAEMEEAAAVDLELLMNQYLSFTKRFGNILELPEMNAYVWDCMRRAEQEIPAHTAAFFSIQCQAMMSNFLLKVSGLEL